jgi:hypothetical protein
VIESAAERLAAGLPRVADVLASAAGGAA